MGLDGPKESCVSGSPEVLRDVAMATNIGMQFPITGFLALDGL